MRMRMIVLFAFASLVASARAPGATTIVVGNLDDSGPGSLRAAILTAGGGTTTITFDPALAGGEIVLSSPLPAIAGGTTIDGDLDGDCIPDIALDGTTVAGFGLRVDTPGCTVRGLAVGGFGEGGIVIGSPSDPDLRTVIECCFIGLRLDGVTAHPTGGAGIDVGSHGGGSRIGPGNLVAHNAGAGVRVAERLDEAAFPDFHGLTADAAARFPALEFPPRRGPFASSDGITPTDGGGHPFTANFGMRLSGELAVDVSGDYTMAVDLLDDRARLVLDGLTVLEDHSTSGQVTVPLTAGVHAVELDFLHYGGAAGLGLTISGPASAVLSHDGRQGLAGELFQLRRPVEGVTITGNVIFANGGRGIELQCGHGPTDDDSDLDLGPNTCLNPPAIETATPLGGRTFELAGTAPAGATVEIFASAGDPSGHGEGRAMLATATAAPSGAFTVTMTLPAGFFAITATATDAAGNSSEFGRNYGLFSHEITVTSSADSGPGTLRDALEQSNSDGTATEIRFDPALAGVTIALQSPLPVIGDPSTTVDGDVDGDCWPDVELDGSAVDEDGLRITSSHNLVRGLVVNNFGNYGLRIEPYESNPCDDNTVTCCFIGTDPSGTVAAPNGRTHLYAAGIRIAASSGNLIGGDRASARNLVSGNLSQGIGMGGAGTTGNVVAGNLIGTDVSGTSALPNSYSGVDLQGDADGNTIGGERATRGNLVSGNQVGVNVSGNGNTIAGNLVGSDVSGTFALPNTVDGIVIGGGADDNLVGGLAATDGNLLSGNAWRGVLVIGEGSDANHIEGNLIGTDISGVGALGNGLEGVAIYGGVGNVVGSTDPLRRNVICSNGAGVNVWFDFTVGTQIIGNWIGIGADGASHLGNGDGVGLWLESSGAVVGGPGGAANWIAYNGAGVTVLTQGGIDNRISRNSIHDNGGLGIDLGEEGVDLNDPGDGDDGPNHLVNAPVLTTATTACGASATTVAGTVDTPNPDAGLVELFGSPAADPSGHGEGRTFLAQTVPAFNGAFTLAVPVQPAGSVITATFTDGDGNTSEFSNAGLVQTTPLAPSGLLATPAAGPAIDLAWLDNSNNESGFRIERRAAGSPGFSFLVTVAANTTSYHDGSGLSPGTTYYYRVRAQGPCLSAWSNVASAIVPAAGPAFCRTTLTHHDSALQPVLEYGNGFFGAAWRECDGESCAIAYAKLSLTGAVVAGPVIVTPWADRSLGPQLRWNGSEWGLLWFESLGNEWGLFFERLGAAGELQAGSLRVDGASEPMPPGNSRNRGLAWDGAGRWGVVWRGEIAGGRDIYFAGIDAQGALAVTETVVDDSGAEVSEPLLAHTGTEFGVVWLDWRDPAPQFYLRGVGPDGGPLGPAVQVTANVAWRAHSDLVWSGSEYGLTWVDTRDGDDAVYFTRFDATGATLSSETRLSDPNIPDELWIQAYDLVLRHLGDRWVVASEDWRTLPEAGEIQLSWADSAGARLGADRIISGVPDGVSADFPALAWSGSVLLAGWFSAGPPDSSEIHVQALDAAGNPGLNPHRTVTAGHVPGCGATQKPTVVATGLGYAATWLDSRSWAVEGADVFLRLADLDGVPTGPEVAVADAVGDTAFAAIGPPLAYSGEVLGVLWRDGSGQLYLGRYDDTGAALGPAVPLGTSRHRDALLWTGDAFLAAWTDTAYGNQEIVTAAIAADGTVLTAWNRISYANGQSRGAALAGDGRARAVAWHDFRDGNWEIYAAALDPLGRLLGSDIRITDDPATQSQPALAWSGSEFLLAWQDGREPTVGSQVRARRLAADATPLGGETVVSDGSGTTPEVMWDGSGWGVAFGGPGGTWFSHLEPNGSETGPDRLVLRSAAGPSLIRNGSELAVSGRVGGYIDQEVVLVELPCALDDTPPTCPSGLDATVSGVNALLSWQPGGDDDGAPWWQAISRDGVRVGVVAPGVTSFADRPEPFEDHTYVVSTLNLGGLESPGCPQLVLDEEAWVQPIFADGFESGTTAAWSAAFP